MLTQDDIIYFVITDRFCNGNPRNYQLVDPENPRAFHGGDFAGLRAKIPYFKQLGVTAVWLTPVYLNIGDFFDSAGYHGYWAIDFERIDPHLYSELPGWETGSKAYLKDLVGDFHAAGLKVILDMVVNHTGYHSPDYQAYPDKKLRFPEHFNPEDSGADETRAWLAGLPDLDHAQPEVADYFVQNILDWIEQTGIDAIRMDTVKHVADGFWYLFKAQVKTSHPQVTLLGEVLNYDPESVGRYQRQHDFDSLFDFPLCGQLKGCLIWDQPMTKLARPRLHSAEAKGILDRDKPYNNANRLVTLLDNHDLERRICSEILDRVAGDREQAAQILKLCLSFLFTTRGIPQIYYGTEVGLEGWGDPDTRRDMPWALIGADHQPKAGEGFAGQIYQHLQQLIRLRKANPALRYGTLYTLYVDQFLYAYLREYRGALVLVAINNGRAPMPAAIKLQIAANSNLPPRIKRLLADGVLLKSQFDDCPDLPMSAGKLRLTLPGKTAGIYCL